MDRESRPSSIHLKDYKPYPFKLHETRLEFFLDPKATRVIAELDFEGDGKSNLELDGEELRLISIAVNGEELSFGHISIGAKELVIDADILPKGRFTLRSEVEISPENNTALEGLYISNEIYSTQCEAQGFRRITYYPDRPDVMTSFRVKIHADLPVRLSNGNLVNKGKGWSEWHDPWPKPCYLFALVAGKLEIVKDKFATASGRKIDLHIYVRKGDEERCDYAMDALKRSMRWDEMAYGREYDLDLFMIVAVDDFNMGAMENKGLNIFNSVLVLASPETATDTDYARIESVIAHEYFHNWTGNRITCRDWFQLSLKEGLTVFRDQQFSAHERSAAVQRIQDVKMLRARQFPEDNGPLAHPVRPESYIAIDNFYTATIYEKGAELIGMMHALVGREDYRKALDLYFERHDGEACTIEDWLQVFADVTGRELAQFKLWYEQSGTPQVNAKTGYQDDRFTLHLEQELPPTPGQPKKKPMLIPLRYTIYSANGDVASEGLIEFDDWKDRISFELPENSVLSLNQGFSAPIYLEQNPTNRPFLLRHDRDPFNRWEAGREMALDILANGNDASEYIAALGELIEDNRLDADYRALLLALPDFNEIASADKRMGQVPDPDAIDLAQESLIKEIASANKAAFGRVYKEMNAKNTGSLSAEAAGERALALAALRYLSAIETGTKTAKSHFKNAKLMTDKTGSLALLVKYNEGKAALAKFYKDFADDRLVVDKWLALQAGASPKETALETVKTLSQHEAFQNPNPNRFRSLYGVFALNNPSAFHAKDGAAYQYFADRLIEFDAKNPQIAARLSAAFQSWRDFDEERQKHAYAALERIASAPGISNNLVEMVTRLMD